MTSGFIEGSFGHNKNFFIFQEYYVVKVSWSLMKSDNLFKLREDVCEYLEQIAPGKWSLGTICCQHWVDVWIICSPELALNFYFAYGL